MNSEPGLAVARLSSDGLTVVEKLANTKISNTSKPIDTKWHFKRGNRDYLIFSERGGHGLYMARSSNGVLGPYERSSQILISGDFWEPNVITENERYHLIFGSWISENAYLVSLKWDSDNWPYAVSFTNLSSKTTPVSIPTTCPVPVPCPTPVTCPDCPKPVICPKPVTCPEPVTVTYPTPVTCPICPAPVKCPMPVTIPKEPSTETQDEKQLKSVISDIFKVDDNVDRSKYSFHIHDIFINVHNHKNNDKE